MERQRNFGSRPGPALHERGPALAVDDVHAVDAVGRELTLDRPDASGWTVIDTGMSKQLFYRRTESLMIMIQFPGDSHFDYFAESAGTWEFRLFGVVGNVQMAVDTLNSLFRDEQAPSVRWHYLGAHGGTYEDISLMPEDRRDTRDSFYPWLDGGVESYLQRYTKSSSPILLMAGPPGTGIDLSAACAPAGGQPSATFAVTERPAVISATRARSQGVTAGPSTPAAAARATTASTSTGWSS